MTIRWPSLATIAWITEAAISLDFTEHTPPNDRAGKISVPADNSRLPAKKPVSLRGFAAGFSKASATLGSWAPKGLYVRALIIIIAPIVILQSILTFVFLDRHWQVVTRRLSTATSQDIAMLADAYELMKNKVRRNSTAWPRSLGIGSISP